MRLDSCLDDCAVDIAEKKMNEAIVVAFMRHADSKKKPQQTEQKLRSRISNTNVSGIGIIWRCRIFCID